MCLFFHETKFYKFPLYYHRRQFTQGFLNSWVIINSTLSFVKHIDDIIISYCVEYSDSWIYGQKSNHLFIASSIVKSCMEYGHNFADNSNLHASYSASKPNADATSSRVSLANPLSKDIDTIYFLCFFIPEYFLIFYDSHILRTIE